MHLNGKVRIKAATRPVNQLWRLIAETMRLGDRYDHRLNGSSNPLLTATHSYRSVCDFLTFPPIDLVVTPPNEL